MPPRLDHKEEETNTFVQPSVHHFSPNPAKWPSIRAARETRLSSDVSERIHYVLSEEQPVAQILLREGNSAFLGGQQNLVAGFFLYKDVMLLER